MPHHSMKLRNKPKIFKKSTIGSKGKGKKSKYAKDEIVDMEMLGKTIHKDLFQNPPQFLVDGFEKIETHLKTLSSSVETLQKENDALKIEVLKQMDYTGGTNMKILELLTLQNNNFIAHSNHRVHTPTPRRNSPFIFQGTPTLANTGVYL